MTKFLKITTPRNDSLFININFIVFIYETKLYDLKVTGIELSVKRDLEDEDKITIYALEDIDSIMKLINDDLECRRD